MNLEKHVHNNLEHILGIPIAVVAYNNLNLANQALDSLFSILTAGISAILITYLKYKFSAYLEKKKKKGK